jgi:hypothetical protein
MHLDETELLGSEAEPGGGAVREWHGPNANRFAARS